VAKDAAALKMFKKFDLITAFDAIHIQAQPRIVLRRIANALRSDGRFLMVDFAASSRVEENLDHPLGPFMYTFSCMHCMTVSLAQDGEGLGAVWGEEKARQMLTKAGFTHIEKNECLRTLAARTRLPLSCVLATEQGKDGSQVISTVRRSSQTRVSVGDVAAM
jgi:SAM-dependent methyltransferase